MAPSCCHPAPCSGRRRGCAEGDEVRRYESQTSQRRAPSRHASGLARGPARASAAAELLRLQRTAGNAAVVRLLQRQPQTAPAPLLQYDLTLPDFVGIPRLEQAKLNDPPLKRETDRTGPAVYAIQKALILSGLPMPRSTRRNEKTAEAESPNDPGFTDRSRDPDGVWGDETTNKLWQFQNEHHLSPDARDLHGPLRQGRRAGRPGADRRRRGLQGRRNP